MGKRRKTFQDDQLPLSLAAGIVFDRIVRGDLKQNGDFRESLNRTGLAILNVVPVYVYDLYKRESRILTASEATRITVSRGAAQLTTSDGSTFLTPTIKRSDIEVAVGLLMGGEAASIPPHTVSHPEGSALSMGRDGL